VAILVVPSFEAQSVNNRGVILVLLLLAAGLGAAATALWHQYRQTRRALDFWGTAAASLIGHAPSVELTALSHGQADGKDSDQTKTAGDTVDLSEARGLVHFRRGLLEDQNFNWDREPPDVVPDWGYLVRFSDDNASVVVAFDLDRRVVGIKKPSGAAAALTDRMSEGLATFFEQSLAQADE
jgi:hypothetical protein